MLPPYLSSLTILSQIVGFLTDKEVALKLMMLNKLLADKVTQCGFDFNTISINTCDFISNQDLEAYINWIGHRIIRLMRKSAKFKSEGMKEVLIPISSIRINIKAEHESLEYMKQSVRRL